MLAICDYPGCNRKAEVRLREPFRGYMLCGRCVTWRKLGFLIYVVSQGKSRR